MKKGALALIFLLMTALTFVNVPSISSTSATETEDLWITYAGETTSEPMPANFTTDYYLDTTNPYADFVDPQGALDEVDDAEGDNPLYVLVFGDEEERQILRYWKYLYYLDWKG